MGREKGNDNEHDKDYRSQHWLGEGKEGPTRWRTNDEGRSVANSHLKLWQLILVDWGGPAVAMGGAAVCWQGRLQR